MNQQTPRHRNARVTWQVRLYGSWGDGGSAKLLLGTHLVTLIADAQGQLSAEIDGQAEETLRRAVSYLEWAKAEGSVQKVSDSRRDPAPEDCAPVIGKGRACTLHKIMGLAGLPSAQHYAISAAALGEPWPLSTLADLTEREAQTVWAHLCRVYPCARELGRQLQARRLPVSA